MNHARDLRLFLILSALAVAASLVLVWRYPVFFRADDYSYLHWVHTHPNPFAAFDLGENIFASYRPLMYLAWWGLVKVFALNPVPYQIFVTLTYALAFVAFFLLARRVFTTRVAALALVAYALVFFKLGFIVFWFSDLTFTLQMLFWNLALYFLVRGTTESRYLIAGVACHVLGALAKEPGMLLVPLIFGATVLSTWRQTPTRPRNLALTTAIVLTLVALPLVAIHPTIQNRVGVRLTDGIAAVWAFAGPRWSYYAGELTRGPGALLVLAALFLFLREALAFLPGGGRPRSVGKTARSRALSAPVGNSWLTTALPLAAALALTFLLRPHPDAALAVLLLAIVLAALPGLRLAFPGVWLVVPVLGLMTSNFMTRSYLIEPSFGAALLVAVFLDHLVAWGRRILGRLPALVARVGLAFALAGVITGALMFSERIGRRTEALGVVSAHRLNARELLESAISSQDPSAGTLVVIDYADRGVDYVRDVLPLPDFAKARLQKTLVSDELGLYLEVAGARDRRAVSYGAFVADSTLKEAVALVMNEAEFEFLDESGLDLEVRREVVRGDERAWLMGLTKRER